jgi:hypothetical protein
MLTRWILTVVTHTISSVILTVGLYEREHFPSTQRFFSRAIWGLDRASAVVFSMIVETLLTGEPEYETVIDDTRHNHVG